MIPELHLFIIWSNAKHKETEILSDMTSRFRILGIHPVTWEKRQFAANLSRFYGENLPPHSNKEKLCGNDPFTLVVVSDESPLYRTRMTSKGPEIVNVNVFDSKEMYRHWTGGGHMVHGTNCDAEARHDLILLTGYSKRDYLKMTENSETPLHIPFGCMPGETSWRDMDQILYVLNETVSYVILRNFHDLFQSDEKSAHGDIDILTSNRSLTRLVLNAKPVYQNKRRVQHVVKIGSGQTYFDIRYVGDDYYCESWEKEIIEKRYLTDEGYYRTNEENFAYSLLYHALIQKKRIADDYKKTFEELFPGQSEEQLRTTLLTYLKEKGYSINEPYDYSVFFNRAVTGKKMSMAKITNKVWHRLFR